MFVWLKQGSPDAALHVAALNAAKDCPDGDALRARYAGNAELCLIYAGYGDYRLYRMDPESGRCGECMGGFVPVRGM